LDTLSKACQENTLNAAQMKDLLKLASSSARQTKRLCASEQLAILWTPTAWDQLRVKLAASDRFKSSTALLNSCKQIAHLAGAPLPQANVDRTTGAQPKQPKKRKVDETKTEHTEKSPEKGKRKKPKKA
jgi:DNA polymerase phi